MQTIRMQGNMNIPKFHRPLWGHHFQESLNCIFAYSDRINLPLNRIALYTMNKFRITLPLNRIALYTMNKFKRNYYLRIKKLHSHCNLIYLILQTQKKTFATISYINYPH